MWLATTTVSGGPFGTTGSFFIINPPTPNGDLVEFERATLPFRTNMTLLKSAFCEWTRGAQSRKFILGSATENLVFTENNSLCRIGIQPPSGPLVLTGAPTE